MVDSRAPRGKGLADFETQDPVLRARHGDAVHASYDRLLSRSASIQYGAIGLTGLIGSLVCGSLALTEPATTPASVRGLLALFAVFGLGWTILATSILSRGVGNLIAQRVLAARMGFGFTLTTIIALVYVTFLLGRGAAATPMLVAALALLILAAVIVTDVRIERSESVIREQILRLECRLIDLAATTKGPNPDRADDPGRSSAV